MGSVPGMKTPESLPGGQREWMHVARDGARLFVRALDAGKSARGLVVIVHGFGEYSGRYLHVMQCLAEAGFSTVAMDLRGHGRSEGKRGDVASYELLLEDLRGIWEESVVQGDRAGESPAFIYGHSLGGQIVLNFAAAFRPRAAGLVITSPWLALAFAPKPWRIALAWLAVRVWPSFLQGVDIRPERLSRDLPFLAAMPDLDLAHHRMSARMFQFFSLGARQAKMDARTLKYPILLVHGSDDLVTSVSATQEFFRELKSEDKTLVIIPDGRHEMHNDLCRHEVCGHITAWLSRHSQPQAGG